MRAKEDLLNDLGITQEYNPRGGLHPDTKDVVLIEVLIDIRDMIELRFCQLIDRVAALVEKD